MQDAKAKGKATPPGSRGGVRGGDLGHLAGAAPQGARGVEKGGRAGGKGSPQADPQGRGTPVADPHGAQPHWPGGVLLLSGMGSQLPCSHPLAELFAVLACWLNNAEGPKVIWGKFPSYDR